MFVNSIRTHLKVLSLVFFYTTLIFLSLFNVIYASDLEGDDESIIDSSDALPEEETKKLASLFPEEYTLMLLDRSRIDWETISRSNAGLIWPFIAPQVREMENRDIFHTNISMSFLNIMFVS